ncbi:hypothetical protein ACFLR7_00465 [Acidobacteriota bacterium]
MRVNIHTPIKTNLLDSVNVQSKWVPFVFRKKNAWVIFSGEWKHESPGKIMFLCDPAVNFGENYASYCSRVYSDFTLNLRFRFLKESIRPPEGGVIIYFYFKNYKNFFSFHFCLPKQRIEFVKRLKGIWSICSGENCNFVLDQDYSVSVNSFAGTYNCQIDGLDIMTVRAEDVSNGYLGIGTKFCDVEFSQLCLNG